MHHGRKIIIAKIILITLLTGLNGCYNTYYTDNLKTSNGKSKSEHFSKYEKPSYRVLGQNYHVLTSAKNYEEKGVASWYGRRFHKLRTSSGERFDMLAMTAAHKTLP